MKNRYVKNSLLSISAIIFTACGNGSDSTATSNLSTSLPATTEQASTNITINSKEQLGELLFNDTSLSLNRTMVCATCHNQNRAFTDGRNNASGAAVSVGQDGTSFGDRNAPMITYASFTPDFNLGNLTGGQFLDGRASNLTEQAKGPFLNPVEMQMPDETSVVERVRENSSYITALQSLYGDTIFDNTESTYNAMADAIAAFERTGTFSAFDSDFDTNNMSTAAQRGLALFRSRRVNCVRCHNDRGNALFTNFRYENLGIPTNTLVSSLNGEGVDHGLLENPNVSSQAEDGKFKVSSLRNVAVTGPYMHNGIFKSLKTVVHFYNTRDTGGINPETGVAWASPEINSPNIVRNDVGNLGLTDAEENDIVAFLEALTDARYKSLIP